MMELIIPFIPEKLTNCLGWTIIHSIWQASVIGILYLLAVKSLSVYHAKLRYILSISALISILGTALLTFLLLHISFAEAGIREMTAVNTKNSGSIPLLTFSSAETMGNLCYTSLKNWLNSVAMHFHQLIFIWVSGILVFTLKTAGGVCLMYRYKTRNVAPLNSDLVRIFNDIRQRLNIRKSVRYLVSDLIDVPMVIGFIKPVILVPSSIISGLTIAQIEAIIIHEFAHISRQDYLVNLIQSVIEILFFYHPVVWIISRQARIEREHCCDDTTIDVCDTSDTYVRALASLTAIRFASPVPSTSLALNGKHLYYRIKRILKMNKMKNNYHNKIIAGVFIISAAVLIILGTSKGTNYNSLSANSLASNDPNMTSLTGVQKIPAVPELPQTSMPQDTTIKVRNNKVTKTIEHNDGKNENIDMIIKDGMVQELVINGVTISKENMDEYQTLINETMNELNNMEAELRNARTELESVDFNEIQDQLKLECEHLQVEIGAEMEQLKKELQDLQIEIPDIHINPDSLIKELELSLKNIQIDKEKLTQEMETALEQARTDLKEIDMERIREEIREAMEEVEFINQEQINQALEEASHIVENIDREKIQNMIQESIRKMEQIDIQEMQHSIQEAIQDVMDGKNDVENEKARIEEMIMEIEKLELDAK
jgi:beta-lactamase regulating signal transducer with metallopeptidase domain